MTRSPVSLELFDLVTAYASQLQPEDAEAALGHAADLLVFGQNFYAQFFQNELHFQITGLDLVNKQKAIAFRLQPGQALAPEMVPLLQWFEHLCDIAPDVQALSYNESDTQGVPDFLSEYMPTLFERIEAWAAAQPAPKLVDRTRRAASALAAGLERLQL